MALYTSWLSSLALSFRTPEINHKCWENITYDLIVWKNFGQENLL